MMKCSDAKVLETVLKKKKTKRGKIGLLALCQTFLFNLTFQYFGLSSTYVILHA